MLSVPDVVSSRSGRNSLLWDLNLVKVGFVGKRHLGHVVFRWTFQVGILLPQEDVFRYFRGEERFHQGKFCLGEELLSRAQNLKFSSEGRDMIAQEYFKDILRV